VIHWEQIEVGQKSKLLLIDDVMENKAQEKFIIIISVLLGIGFHLDLFTLTIIL
jgi:hypothetical protein